MKDNVIYINFSYRYKKKKFIALIKKIFNKSYIKPTPKHNLNGIVTVYDFDKKRIL